MPIFAALHAAVFHCLRKTSGGGGGIRPLSVRGLNDRQAAAANKIGYSVRAHALEQSHTSQFSKVSHIMLKTNDKLSTMNNQTVLEI